MPEHKVISNQSASGYKPFQSIKTEDGFSLLSLMYEVAILRCFIKWIIRLVTNTCQLQRILIKSTGAVRTMRVEKCLIRSQSKELNSIVRVEPVDMDNAVEKIMQIKGVQADANPMFFASLRTCLIQIHGFATLMHEVETIRTKKYDSSNVMHEKLLSEGEDPQTDFRGMGLLGLRNLVYFAEQHNQLAMQALQHSQHPKYGYSYAIVGINITSMAYELMCNGLLRSHFFNAIPGRPCMNDFHEVYCYLFYEFDKFWMKSEPENIMLFGQLRDEFLKTVEDVLSLAPSASLALDART